MNRTYLNTKASTSRRGAAHMLVTGIVALAMAFAAEAGNLILVGDSTLAPRKPEQRIGSWGDAMGEKLKEGWKIVNVAIGGRTVKSIQNSGKNAGWQKALDAMQPGDFVIVQFGINDAAKTKLVDIPEFKEEFAKLAKAIRAKGATPVFCSPVTSGSYGKDGKFVRNKSRRKYADATRDVAAAEKVDFIDMTELTCQILDALDKQAGQDLYVGKSTKNGKPIFDTCHPSKAGAKRYGEAFIKDATARKLPIAAIFKQND